MGRVNWADRSELASAGRGYIEVGWEAGCILAAGMKDSMKDFEFGRNMKNCWQCYCSLWGNPKPQA
jgi:hypothetical protein